MKEQILSQLNEFKNKGKFIASEWGKRGLNPSDSEMCNRLESFFNHLAEILINFVNDDSPKKILKKGLKNNLSQLNREKYDTEEREFIVEYFFELSQILKIDFKELNNWLYGFPLNSLLKMRTILNKEPKILETLSQNCTKCNSSLVTYIIQKEEGLQNGTFNIVRCISCGEVNLIEIESGIKEYRFGNYDVLERINKKEINLEELKNALQKLNIHRNMKW
jgi:hypothetical protein